MQIRSTLALASVFALSTFSTTARADCPPPTAAAACLFGEQFSDIRDNPALQILSETWIVAVDGLTPIASEQLVLAVQQSSHTDVTTPAEALQRVDQQEVRDIALLELASGRIFTVLEYGVGDNSYGAFFEQGGSEVLASIHDGDLLACSVAPADATP